MTEQGYKTTAESSCWRVTIEHTNAMGGTDEELMDLIRIAFRGQFGESSEKYWFDGGEE